MTKANLRQWAILLLLLVCLSCHVVHSDTFLYEGSGIRVPLLYASCLRIEIICFVILMKTMPWLSLFTHSKKVVASIFGPRGLFFFFHKFCVPPCVCLGSLQLHRLPPTVQRPPHQANGKSKLVVGTTCAGCSAAFAPTQPVKHFLTEPERRRSGDCKHTTCGGCGLCFGFCCFLKWDKPAGRL